MTLIATCFRAVESLSPLSKNKRLHHVLLEYTSAETVLDSITFHHFDIRVMGYPEL